MTTIRIQIQVPIWKTRSIGISLINSNPKDEIEIEIAYLNKDGNQIYPHIYSLTAQEIHNYGVKYVRHGVPLYEVPIADLRIKESRNNLNNNKPQNQTTMLFDSKEIDKIRKENASRSESKKKLDKGEHVLTFTNPELVFTKEGKHPMIKVDLIKDEDHKPLTEYFVLAGPGGDMGKSKLVAILDALGYAMTQAKDEKDVLKQVKALDGKKLKVAVRWENSLYDAKDKGWMIAQKPSPWYYGRIDEATFKVDIAKCERNLSDKDMAKITELANLGVEVKGPDGNPVISASTQGNETVEHDVFAKADSEHFVDSRKQEPTKAVENSAPVVTNNDDDDDLPF